MKEQVIPSINIPSDRTLDVSERNRLVAAFRNEYVRLNPGYTITSLDHAAEAFRKQVIQSDPALREFDRKQAERQAARDTEAQAQADKHAARQREQAETALEADRVRMLAEWTRQGGTEEQFQDRWPALKIQLIEERTLRATQRQRPSHGAARTWKI